MKINYNIVKLSFRPGMWVVFPDENYGSSEKRAYKIHSMEDENNLWLTVRGEKYTTNKYNKIISKLTVIPEGLTKYTYEN